MHINKKQPFFIGCNNSQVSPQTGAFIFDETYKTKLQKNKFEHNPKFAYYNAVIKIRSRLSEQQHQVYEMLFDPELQQQQDNKWRNISSLSNKDKLNITLAKWNQKQNDFHNRSSQLKQYESHSNTYRNSVRQINFQSTPRHKKGSQIYYDKKPRLDDILAEYRRMNRKQAKSKNNSFIISKNKKIPQQFMLFNRTGRILPRQFSQPQRGRKNLKQ